MPEEPASYSPHGIHIAMECSGCDRALLQGREKLEEAMIASASEAGASVVESMIHAFNPIGLSGVVVIAESHLAVHTWPEISYASFDIYTCGKRELAEAIADNLEKIFAPEKVTRQLFERRPPGAG